MNFILGIILKGGVKFNIILEEVELEYYIWVLIKKELDVLMEKVINCFYSVVKVIGCIVCMLLIWFLNLS